MTATDPQQPVKTYRENPISTMRWTEKSEFEGIDLNDSFVLSWSVGEGRLTFEIEASIWPDSPFYDPPLPGEHTCYKRAQLEFDGFQAIDGFKPIERTESSVDPDGSRDFGNIDELEDTKNGFRICGDFGSVEIVGGAMKFTINTS